MKKLSFALLFASALAFAAPKPQVQVTADSLVWTEPFGPGSIKVAKVSGDEKKGPYFVIMKMPPGFDSGWHTHDFEYTGVVLAGTLENIEQGGEAASKPIPAGSSWTQMGKVNHMTKCTAATECMSYLAIKGGFTFTPKMPDGKPMPKETAKKEAMPAPTPSK